jgi:hypothetical protein
MCCLFLSLSVVRFCLDGMCCLFLSLSVDSVMDIFCSKLVWICIFSTCVCKVVLLREGRIVSKVI